MHMPVRTKILGLAATLGAAVSLMAGAFVLQIGKPSANPEAQAKNAVLVVRGVACVEQSKTTVTGTAEGIVNGRHESLPLMLIPLSAQSTYAVTQQWPAEGNWVLTFVMANPHFQSQQSAIVKLDNGSVDWAGITRLAHVPTKDDIEAALSTAAVAAR
jgi:hypothetical protein